MPKNVDLLDRLAAVLEVDPELVVFITAGGRDRLAMRRRDQQIALALAVIQRPSGDLSDWARCAEGAKQARDFISGFGVASNSRQSRPHGSRQFTVTFGVRASMANFRRVQHRCFGSFDLHRPAVAAQAIRPYRLPDTQEINRMLNALIEKFAPKKARELTAIREQIAKVQTDADELVSSPLPAAEQFAFAAAEIDRLAESHASRLGALATPDMSRASTATNAIHFALTDGDDGSAVAYFFRDAIKETIKRDLEKRLNGSAGPPHSERGAIIERLESEQRQLETDEEALIEKLEADSGSWIERRTDADPAIILGVQDYKSAELDQAVRDGLVVRPRSGWKTYDRQKFHDLISRAASLSIDEPDRRRQAAGDAVAKLRSILGDQQQHYGTRRDAPSVIDMSPAELRALSHAECRDLGVPRGSCQELARLIEDRDAAAKAYNEAAQHARPWRELATRLESYVQEQRLDQAPPSGEDLSHDSDLRRPRRSDSVYGEPNSTNLDAQRALDAKREARVYSTQGSGGTVQTAEFGDGGTER